MPKTATASAAQVKPSAPKTAVSGKPGSSIAEQNRLLLGGLLDKEAAESGDGQGGEDYIILRDFPFNR